MNKYLSLFILLIVFVSCSKDEIGSDVSVTGFVKLIDDKGIELFEKNDVRVTIQGTSKSDITDKNGKFLFTGLNAGTSYVFDCSKEGYGLVSSSTCQFIGNARPGLVSIPILFQLPLVELSSANIKMSGNNIVIDGTMNPTQYYTLKAFANDSANVSEFHYDYASIFHSGVTNGSGFTSFDAGIFLPVYKPGTTYYIAIYFYNYFDQGYYDYKKKIFLRSSSKKVGTLRITL